MAAFGEIPLCHPLSERFPFSLQRATEPAMMKLSANTMDSVRTLKTRIQEAANIAIIKQRLIYSARELVDSCLLSEYPNLVLIWCNQFV